MESSEKDMRETFRAYDETVWVPGAEGINITEDESLGEDEPTTCVENREFKYIIRNPTTQVVTPVPISEFEASNAECISQVLRDV